MAKLVAQGKLDGTAKPMYATEAELQGFKETQMPLGIGPGDLPLEELPMFKKEEQRGADGGEDSAHPDCPQPEPA